MDLTRLNLEALDSLNLTELKKEEIEQIIEIAETHAFMINMGDSLSDGEYERMRNWNSLANKCKKFLGE